MPLASVTSPQTVAGGRKIRCGAMSISKDANGMSAPAVAADHLITTRRRPTGCDANGAFPQPADRRHHLDPPQRDDIEALIEG
jgi:hypothetical protein